MKTEESNTKPVELSDEELNEVTGGSFVICNSYGTKEKCKAAGCNWSDKAQACGVISLLG